METHLGDVLNERLCALGTRPHYDRMPAARRIADELCGRGNGGQWRYEINVQPHHAPVTAVVWWEPDELPDF